MPLTFTITFQIQPVDSLLLKFYLEQVDRIQVSQPPCMEITCLRTQSDASGLEEDTKVEALILMCSLSWHFKASLFELSLRFESEKWPHLTPVLLCIRQFVFDCGDKCAR